MSTPDNPYRGPKKKPAGSGTPRPPERGERAPERSARHGETGERAPRREGRPPERGAPAPVRSPRTPERGTRPAYAERDARPPPADRAARPPRTRPRDEPKSAAHGATPTPGGETARSTPPRDGVEIRLYGLNACRAAFAARADDLRKVYLTEARIGVLRDVLAWCVKHRLGYRVVETEDLDKLAASTHHEGVLFEMRRPAVPTLAQLLAALPAGPQTLLWLDGVGNPHNFGAVLRSAAHFGVAAVLLPPGSPLTLSGAAYRVAEGGAEAVPVLALPSLEAALVQLREAGFALAATLPAGGASLYAAELPPRLVLVFGAERSGVQPALVEACSLRLSVPGSGRVESLNIANAVGVMLGERWRRLHP